MYYLRTKAATDAIKFTVDLKYKTETVPVNTADAMAQATAAAYAVEPAQIETVPSFEVQGSNSSGQMSAEEMARQQAAISCSLDNPDSCEMCSG
jgi:ribonucleoside-diphosphate reductase alpha chain